MAFLLEGQIKMKGGEKMPSELDKKLLEEYEKEENEEKEHKNKRREHLAKRKYLTKIGLLPKKN